MQVATSVIIYKLTIEKNKDITLLAKKVLRYKFFLSISPINLEPKIKELGCCIDNLFNSFKSTGSYSKSAS